MWEVIIDASQNERLSSLDFTVYAYLKEEIINTEESKEVMYLKANCPKLMSFYEFMETLFGDKSTTNMEEDLRKAEHRQKFFAANKVRFI